MKENTLLNESCQRQFKLVSERLGLSGGDKLLLNRIYRKYDKRGVIPESVDVIAELADEYGFPFKEEVLGKIGYLANEMAYEKDPERKRKGLLLRNRLEHYLLEGK